MGNRGTAVLVAAVVATAILTAVRFRERPNAERALEAVAEPSSGTRNKIQPSFPNSQRELNSTTDAQLKEKVATEPEEGSIIGNGIEQSSPKLGSLESVGSLEVLPPALDDTTVGRPFPVSRSAQPHCVRGSVSSDCEDQQRLDEFAQEPRDPAWALQVETSLRNLIDQRNPGFSIRNVECRLTTCVLEVESLEGHLNPRRNLHWKEWDSVNAEPFVNRAGLERDSLGRRITVTLWIYGRIR